MKIKIQGKSLEELDPNLATKISEEFDLELAREFVAEIRSVNVDTVSDKEAREALYNAGGNPWNIIPLHKIKMTKK